MIGSLCRLLAIATSFSMIACSRPTPEKRKATIAADEGEARNMWYRVRVATRYAGQPITIDQLVLCYMRTVPGAALGTIPATTGFKMHPRSVGRMMPDGSFLAARLPDLCGYNRPRKRGEFGWFKLPGWRAPGPFPVRPLMVWSDRPVRPSTIEAYVGEAYFQQSGARIARPTAEVAFLPGGFPPERTLAVLRQTNAVSEDMGMEADMALPISDPTARAQVAAYLRTPPTKGQRFTTYRTEMLPAGMIWGETSAPFHLNWQDTRDCLWKWQAGRPNGPDFPANPETGQALEQPEIAALHRVTTARWRACLQMLDRVVPFTWNGHAFVADTRRRGVVVFQPRSAATRNATYFIDGEAVSAAGAVHDRRSGEWWKLNRAYAPGVDPDGGE